jgi:clan AA aspartic protease (TIGR02281 family)
LAADTITLTNGRTVEGIITRETDAQITLDFGVGSTTVPRNRIRSMQRSNPEARAAMESGWQKKNYLHEKYVPAGYAELAAEFLRVSQQRDAARAAQGDISDAHREEVRLGEEADLLQRMFAETSARLQSASPSNGVVAYNALVATNNILQSRLTLARSGIEATRKRRGKDTEQVLAYDEAFQAFERKLADVKPPADDLPDVEARRYFLEQISGAMRVFGAEFVTSRADGEASASGTFLTVRINGVIDGRFLLDTGASMVTLTEAFASRIPIDPTPLPSGQFTMADGRKVSGKIATLASVKVGDAQAENVAAVILPTGSGQDTDGLLGMSFLKHYAVHLEGSSGKVTFRRFDPK